MKTIRSILAIFLFLCVNHIFAQDYKDGAALVPLTIVTSEQEGLTPGIQSIIKDKLMQVVVKNGMGNSDSYSRFAITASVVESAKDYTAGPPRQVVLTSDITFYIVDNFDHKIFSTVTLPVKSVDYSEERALMKTLRNINPNNPAIADFVTKGKEKIIAYYNAQINNIIAKANSLAVSRNYEEAFYLLSSVPEACADAYMKAIETGNSIYKDWADYEGERLLALAKSAWVANYDKKGAVEAGNYLSRIEPDAACYSKAEALYDEIKAKSIEDWKFELKRYQDGVDLERMRISAWQSVGVAYGNHQQAMTYNTTWLYGR